MKLKVITYRTLTGTKDVFKSPKQKSTQWVICQDNVPTYFMDCFDFKYPANLAINNWVLSEGKTMGALLKKICKQEKVALSIVKPPYVRILVKTESKEFALKPLPIAWFT